MKKYWLLLLLFYPFVSFGAPSVRMLGAQPSATAAVSSGAKIVPVKSTAKNTDAASARIGSLRAKNKSNSLVSTSGSLNSSSRLPAAVPVPSYDSVALPKTNDTSNNTGSGTTPVPTPTNVDVAAIIDAVTANVESDLYNSNDLRNMIQGMIPVVDEARFDMIRTSNPHNVHGKDAPTGFTYIWVEEN